MADANWKRTERAKTVTTQELLNTIKVNVTQFLRDMHVSAPVTKKKQRNTNVQGAFYWGTHDRSPMWVHFHTPRSKRLEDVPF